MFVCACVREGKHELLWVSVCTCCNQNRVDLWILTETETTKRGHFNRNYWSLNVNINNVILLFARRQKMEEDSSIQNEITSLKGPSSFWFSFSMILGGGCDWEQTVFLYWKKTLVICLNSYRILYRKSSWMNELLLPVLNWHDLFLPWMVACVPASWLNRQILK